MTIFLKGNEIITEEQIIAEEVIQYLKEKLLIVNNGQKFNQVLILAGGAGCYPKGTEFFTPDGWKNIEYYNGEKVLEIERDLISERTKSGLQAAKEKGKILGRPKGTLGKSKLDGREHEIVEYLQKGVSKSSIAKIMEVSRTCLYSFIQSRKLEEQ